VEEEDEADASADPAPDFEEPPAAQAFPRPEPWPLPGVAPDAAGEEDDDAPQAAPPHPAAPG
jgi:hypothetical protein